MAGSSISSPSASRIPPVQQPSFIHAHFYPLQLKLIESLDFLFLLKSIEDFYKSEDGENLEILCPVQDQACVAKFEDGVWYRAKVIGLPGHREVEVKYVDFGNTAKITLREMRKIKDEFLNPPEKAIKCKLAYIEPCKKTTQWSEQAKEKFEEKTQDKFMTCSVIKILEDNVLLVELFDSLGAPGMTPTSINHQLVKEGLASYEVGLEEKMVAAYENSKWEPVKWENGMHCAVEIPENNQWRRGQIIRMVTDSLVEVLLYDVGVEVVVNITCLRELEDTLKATGRLSLECALVDIRINKLDNSHSLSEKSLEIPLKDDDSVVTNCTEINLDPDTLAADITSKDKVSEFKEEILEPRPTGCYKPPVIPDMEVFEAVVTCVGDDGTVFVVPKLSEFELMKMMSEIQSNLKCLGLLEPYFWKKGEACAVRGSDTMWYRGKVMEVVGGMIRVRYLDHGLTEKIPQCHLYPILLYPETPQFCIPCQLHDTIPVGGAWQPDAVELLQELLSRREVEIHITKPTDDSSKYEEERWEVRFEELLLSETETPVFPPYLSSSLPSLEELFAVQVKHVVSPNEVYICLDSVETSSLCKQHGDTDDSGASWEPEPESLGEALHRFNTSVEALPALTDFRTEMPCLAEYDDGLWYRAKIVSIKEFDPLAVLVQFVDYGSTEKLTVNRLRQIPLHLMQYPARAIKVMLAGFKPPTRDSSKTRIPYCPEWSMEALWAMIDCLQGKQLYASAVAQAPEQTVTLYEDEEYPVHMALVQRGLADRDD
ncbi:RING finger protein 17 [Pteropus alecto]|uniref:RING finger protein 17 n=1 Tax=Pteropus alecto TaxID=9402 RepID=L5KC92_PTEAL|nr:RING finger protein 17 [Pteropus alecto]